MNYPIVFLVMCKHIDLTLLIMPMEVQSYPRFIEGNPTKLHNYDNNKNAAHFSSGLHFLIYLVNLLYHRRLQWIFLYVIIMALIGGPFFHFIRSVRK